MALSDKVAVLRKGKYIGTVNTAETNPQALTDMMVGRAVSPEHRPAPVLENPVAAPRRCEDLTVSRRRGREKARRRHVHRHGRRDPRHRGHRRLRPEGAARGHRGPASRGAPARPSSIPPVDEPAAARLIGKTPMQINKAGVALAFVPEDRLGMGLVGCDGHDGQHDAPLLAQGQGRLCQPQGPERAGPAGHGKSWRSSRRASRLSGPAALRRQRAEGARRP